MKKLFLLVVLFSFSFAIKDVLYKSYKVNNSNRVLYKANLDTNTTEDDKNIYFYNNHFRVILGKDYKNSTTYNNLANQILSISEYVWQKEIEELGFRPPRNSDKYLIDIYIANKSAYNDEDDSDVTISSYYAGYATAYSDGTPYFILNPDIGIDILKVTIAHEFFHTIQYAYGLNDVNDDIFYKNVWFLEASAVMMEDEVYDDINDYKNYISSYINNTNKALELYNGDIEYGKVIFAKYLKERFGIDFIKYIFENYNVGETILTTIKNTLKNNNLTIEDALLEFGKWLSDKNNFFEEGSLYPSIKKIGIDNNITIDKYGIVLFKSDNSIKYLISSNPIYLQSDYSGNKNKIVDIYQNGLIFISKQDNLYSKDYTLLNSYKNIKLNSGWNMISNPSSSQINLEELFNGNEIVWAYRDNKYFAYSPNSYISSLIEENNLSMSESIIKPNEAIWVFTDINKTIDFDIEELNDFNLSIKNSNWNFISISSSSFEINTLDDNLSIWHYDNNKQAWSYYSKKYNIDNLDKIKMIIPFRGYFVKKDN